MRKKWKQWNILFSWAPKSCGQWLQPWNYKTLAPWKKSYDSILKSRDITVSTKVSIVKNMIFCSSQVQMWELDHKESWAPKNWCLWTVVLGRLLRVPWIARRSNQSILKEISPEYSLKGWWWSWNSNTLATWCKELMFLNCGVGEDSWESLGL